MNDGQKIIKVNNSRKAKAKYSTTSRVDGEDCFFGSYTLNRKVLNLNLR